MVNKVSNLWRSNSVSNGTKVKLYETSVVPVLLCGSDVDVSEKKMSEEFSQQMRPG